MAIPVKDAELAAYTTNFDARVSVAPATFGLTPEQGLTYSGFSTAFLTAYNAYVAAVTSGTRSKSLLAAKDTAKANLLACAREFYAFIQADTSVSDANKALVGVTVRKTTPTPTPVPSSAPIVAVESVSGRTARLRLMNAESPTHRGKPAGATGASVFTFVGATPPDEVEAWTFQGNTGRAEFDVTFPGTVAAGAVVWFTAFWFNPRKQSGPACPPVSTNLPGGGVLRMAA